MGPGEEVRSPWRENMFCLHATEWGVLAFLGCPDSAASPGSLPFEGLCPLLGAELCPLQIHVLNSDPQDLRMWLFGDRALKR